MLNFCNTCSLLLLVQISFKSFQKQLMPFRRNQIVLPPTKQELEKLKGWFVIIDLLLWVFLDF